MLSSLQASLLGSRQQHRVAYLTPLTVSAALCSHVSLNCYMTVTLVLPASVHAFQLSFVHAGHNAVDCQEVRAVNSDSPARAADDEILCTVYMYRVYTEYPPCFTHSIYAMVKLAWLEALTVCVMI